MVAKKVVIGISCILLITSVSLVVLLENIEKSTLNLKEGKNAQSNNIVQVKDISQQKIPEIKYDMYNDTSYDIPLSAIVEISKIKPIQKKAVDELLEASQGFYFLRYEKESETIFIFLQNPVEDKKIFPRHNLQLAIVDADGAIKYETMGYCGEDGEIINTVEEIQKKDELWVFNKDFEPYRPTKHVVYNEKGKTVFVEQWKYDENEPIKYVMKDNRKKVLSILKETLEDEINLRREHIFYDPEGKILKSFTINYDGSDITRFTYYDAENLQNGVISINEYQDGVRKSETIYNSDFKVKNIIEADINDGKKRTIKLLNPDRETVLEI